MANKRGDLVRLIENPAGIHKTRQKAPDIGRDRSGKKNEGFVASPSTPPTTPEANPVTTTVVISSSSGVHVKQQQNQANDKRTGRYLAVGAILTMIFITFYHTYLRQVPMLAGLVPPAIIMFLYLLWIVYFAKKRKRQMQFLRRILGIIGKTHTLPLEDTGDHWRGFLGPTYGGDLGMLEWLDPDLILAGIPPLDLVAKMRAMDWRQSSDARKRNRGRMLTSWQYRWQHSDKGGLTFDLLPDVTARLKLKFFYPSKNLCQIFTGHGAFRAYLRHFGLTDDPCCPDCGAEDSARHAFLDCARVPPPSDAVKAFFLHANIGGPTLSRKLAVEIGVRTSEILERRRLSV